jgi:hypothetical protein
MVAMLIGLMLVLMVTNYLISSSASNRMVMANSDTLDAKRFALDVIRHQIWLAGYSDDVLSGLTEAFPATDTTESGMPAFQSMQLLAATSDDEIWIRYRGAALAGQPIIQCDGSAVPDGGAGHVPPMVIARLYHQSNRLYCKMYGADGESAAALPLINDVDDIRWRYLSNGSWKSRSEIDANAWAGVSAVQVEAIIASATPTGSSSIEAFEWGEETRQFSDGRARSLMSATIALRNGVAGDTQ